MSSEIITDRPEIDRLLDELHGLGVELTASDGGLRYRAPEGAMTAELRTRLRERRDELLARLRPGGGDALPGTPELFPVTDLQAAYLVGRSEAFQAGGTGCHGYAEFSLDPGRLTGPDPEEAIRQAWRKVLRCHPMLRAQFSVDGFQWTDPQLEVPVRFSPDRERVREELRTKTYPISGAPLLDVVVTTGPQQWILHLSVDLLISDFQGLDTLVADLDRVLDSPQTELQAPSLSFQEYRRRLLGSPDYRRREAEDRDHWADRAGDLPDPLTLSPAVGPCPGPAWRRRSQSFGASSWSGLQDAARGAGTTPTALLTAAVGRVLRRYGEGAAGTIAMTLANRWPLAPDVDRIVGDFTSTVLIGLPGRPMAMDERVAEAHREIFEALAHCGVSGVEIARMAARGRGADRYVTPIVITSTLGVGSAPGRTLRILCPRPEASLSQTPQVLLDIQFSQRQDGLSVDWDCREDGFEPTVLDAAFEDFVLLVSGIAETGRVDDALPVRVPSPIRRTAAAPCGIHEPFLDLARRDPQPDAVVDATGRYSRGQLASAAHAVAQWLQEKGFSRAPVIVNLPPGVAQIAVHIGTLIAGGAYVPVEPDWPSARRDRVAEQVARWWRPGPTVSAGSELLDRIDERLSRPLPATEWPDTRVNPEAAAYVIFTSGSTGTPKGVVTSHAEAMTTLAAMTRIHRLGPADAVLAVSRHSFDLSVFNEFALLGAGGRVIVPASGTAADQRRWLEEVRTHRVTVWNSVPAQLELLLDEHHQAAEPPLAGLRLALVSGDWVPVDLPARTWRAMPDARFVALGGATEAAIWSIGHEVAEPLPADARSVPYGIALPDQGVWVLNADDEPATVGQVGQIVIGGDGVADGYAAAPELTGRSFFSHPLTGERCYRTGDLGRLGPDGEIEFLGRRDRQVKVRGHRIELGEIEAVLSADPRIATALAVVDETGPGRRLAAAVVPAERSVQDPDPEEGWREIGPVARSCVAQSMADPDLLSAAALHRCLDRLAVDHMLAVLAPARGLSREDAVGLFGAEAADRLGRWLGYLESIGQARLQDGRLALDRCPSAEELERSWTVIADGAPGEEHQQAVLAYVRSCLDDLPGLLTGSVDPLELLFPHGDAATAQAIYRRTPSAVWSNALVSRLIATRVEDLNAQGQTAHLLEIGAGTGATTAEVLASMPAGADYDYLFTDVSRYFLDTARATWPQLRTALFDVNTAPQRQGIAPGGVDIVLAANVLHNAHDIDEAMRTIDGLLSPHGIAVIIDSTSDSPLLMTTVEFTEGLGKDLRDSRTGTGSPFLTLRQWQEAVGRSSLAPLLQVPGTQEEGLDFGHQHVLVMGSAMSRHRITADQARALAAMALPRYMVPDAVALIDRVPLTPNGKVDRRALLDVLPSASAGRDGGGAAGTGPLRGLQETAARVWRSVLGLGGSVPLAPDSDFFDLGGDSLLLARCVAQLRREMPQGEDRPWDTVFQAIVATPTIAGCADAFGRPGSSQHGSVGTAGPSSLIPLAPRQDWAGEDLVVLVHDGSGGLGPYADLVTALRGGSRPELAGLHRRADDGFIEAAPKDRVEILADRYLDLLADSAGRPVHLVGYCMGGLIAGAVAARLAAADTPVASLTVISSYRIPFLIEDDLLVDYAFTKLIGRDPAEAGIAVDDVELGRALTAARLDHPDRIGSGDLARHGTAALAGALAAAPPDVDARLRLLLGTGTDQQELREIRDSVASSLAAVASWEPQAYLGDVDFLRQAGKLYFLPDLADDMTAFWSEYCLGELRVHDVPGDHFSCMAGQNAAGLADLLRRIWGRRR